MLNLNPEDCLDNIERVDASTLSYEEFVERYEKPLKPVILTGLTNDWPATSKWTIPVSRFFHFIGRRPMERFLQPH